MLLSLPEVNIVQLSADASMLFSLFACTRTVLTGMAGQRASHTFISPSRAPLGQKVRNVVLKKQRTGQKNLAIAIHKAKTIYSVQISIVVPALRCGRDIGLLINKSNIVIYNI
jgi:hypothetical protein